MRRLVALGCIFVSAVASCSDSKTPPPEADEGGAATSTVQMGPSVGGSGSTSMHWTPNSEAGANPTAGSETKVSSSSAASALGGAAADSGESPDTLPLAGAGGAGGEAGDAEAPNDPSLQCLECGRSECGDRLTACQQNPECSPWLTCVKACGTTACVAACDASYAQVSRVYQGLYGCLCAHCDGSCSLLASCSKKCVEADALPPVQVAPATLAETGLYTAQGNVSPKVNGYDVRFPLWADGAGKGRYVYVPGCATIGTEEMDHWQFPVGTRLWKHFSVGDTVVETRLIHRYGSGASDWLFATYGWDPKSPQDPRLAKCVPHGEANAAGTLHDIPDPSACPTCHSKLPETVLGFSAFQLSHSGSGLTMQRLSDWGWLSVPARQGFSVPGTPVQQAALGYLHGNCGGCHNGSVDVPREKPMKLRLLVGQTSYATTDTVLTTIGIPTINAYAELHDKPRIDPQSRETSAVFLRMSDRNKFPMPPLASKFSDVDGGVAAVGAWIDGLPKQ